MLFAASPFRKRSFDDFLKLHEEERLLTLMAGIEVLAMRITGERDPRRIGIGVSFGQLSGGWNCHVYGKNMRIIVSAPTLDEVTEAAFQRLKDYLGPADTDIDDDFVWASKV